MANGNQLPSGFVLNQPIQPTGLPDGFVLDQPSIVDQIPTGIAGVTADKFGQAQPVPEPSLMEKITGAGEAALTAATGATSGALGYLGGTAKGIGQEIINGDFGHGIAEKEAMKGSQALTYSPRTEVGKKYVENIGSALSSVPAIIPMAAEMQVLAGPALRSIKRGIPLIDKMGEPTQALRKALDKEGLTYENLSPQARALIPSSSNPKLLPSAKIEANTAASRALVQQIKSGARDDALAGIKVVGNKVRPDKSGIEAMRQGFDPGFVQAVKTANPQTKLAMEEMLTKMERITKNRRLALDFRPSDVAGDAALSRFRFIRNKATEARNQLNKIAETRLPGKEVNIKPVIDQLGKSLDDLNIELTGDGIPKPVYIGSQISKDRTSQRIITDLIDLMAEGKSGKKPDALRLHNMKRQLDRMIDFNKKSEGGLTDAGRDVLRDVRKSINSSLREADPAYAKVNDVLSKSLGAMDDFKDSLGPSIAKLDMFEKGTGKAVGTKLRTLMGNQQKRIELENALNKLDDTANSLGGTFNVSYKDLSLFANRLEDRFGAVAESSFKGDIESAIKQAGRQGAKETAKEAAISKAAEKINKLRGINDFNAFKSMRELLRNGKQDK